MLLDGKPNLISSKKNLNGLSKEDLKILIFGR